MTEKCCDNCYYTFFDERAYPCSLCIRGIERTDKWQPSKKTKADHKDEPQAIAEDINRRVEMVKKEWSARHIEDEPLTEGCPTCKYGRHGNITDEERCERCSFGTVNNYEPIEPQACEK